MILGKKPTFRIAAVAAGASLAGLWLQPVAFKGGFR